MALLIQESHVGSNRAIRVALLIQKSHTVSNGSDRAPQMALLIQVSHVGSNRATRVALLIQESHVVSDRETQMALLNPAWLPWISRVTQIVLLELDGLAG